MGALADGSCRATGLALVKEAKLRAVTIEAFYLSDILTEAEGQCDGHHPG